MTASEFIEDELEKLPVLADSRDAPDVIRDEVFCSKIYHTNSTSQTRFTWMTTYAKILAHNGVDVRAAAPPYPRPLKSPFPCFQCQMRFDGPPCFLSVIALNGDRTEWGNFCDPCCVNTYVHRNMNDANTAARMADQVEYCQDVHGFTGYELGFAPHFSEREVYGGSLSDAAFLEIARTPGLRTFERMAPFIPTPVVVEWQCTVEERGTDVADAAVQSALAAASGSGASLAALARLSGTGTKPVEDRPIEVAAATHQSATEALNQVLGMRPDGVDYHFWEVTGLKQPPLPQIEKRLRSLPQPEKKTGSYELYWARKENEEGSSDDDAEAGAPAKPKPATPPAAPVPASAPKKRKAPGAGPAAPRKPPVPKEPVVVAPGTTLLETRVMKRGSAAAAKKAAAAASASASVPPKQ